MRHWIRALGPAAMAIAALGASALGGCQSVSSDHVDLGSSRIAHGLQYAAPKALVRVELVERNGELLLGVSQPFLVGDPEATYTLSASSGLLANQEYLFAVNPQTRLLTYINSVSEGQASRIFENIARGVGGIGALPREEYAGLGQETVIFAKVIDPFEYKGCDFAAACTLTAMDDDLRSHALEYLGCSGAKRASYVASCLKLESDPNYFTITIDPMFTVERAPRAAKATAPSACASSICYRAPAPYRLGLRVAGVSDISELVLLPNEAPIMAMGMPAGVFATARSRVELVQGMPATIAVRKQNEVVAITAIPLTIIRGFFSAIGEVFRLRIDYNSAKVNVMQSDTARKTAEDQNRSLNAARSASAFESAPSTSSDDPSYDSSDSDFIGARAENTLDDFSSDVAPMDDGSANGIAALQGAPITMLSAPRRMFEVPVWKRAAGTAASATPDEDGGGATLGNQ
jgi:hypothetical protein